MKALLSKSRFIEIVEELKEKDDLQKKIESVLGECRWSEGDWNRGGMIICCEETLVELLECCMGDTEGWIKWYLWDNDYGREEGNVEINGRKRKIKSAGDLYDLIVGKI